MTLETGFLALIGDTVVEVATVLAMIFVSFAVDAVPVAPFRTTLVAETVICALLSPRGGARAVATAPSVTLVDVAAPRFYIQWRMKN